MNLAARFPSDQPSEALGQEPSPPPEIAAGAGIATALFELLEDRRALPLPANGETLARWQGLAGVASADLSLAKLYEGHTDAIAILAELQGPPAPAHSLWGTWCAEPPAARLNLEPARSGTQVRLNGSKAWCSGATVATHAVVSAWNPQGEPCLAAVALDQPGVEVTARGWHAVGMAATGSVDVRFDDACAVQIGRAHDYVRRPGFWHGGAGIAACWWGGARAIASMTRALLRSKPDPHALAHLGALDVAVCESAALLREAAAWIDANPKADAARCALRLRAAVEDAANEVMHHAGRAVGAGPLCRDARFARLMADLPVYLRQSHAERDLAALGEMVFEERESEWSL